MNWNYQREEQQFTTIPEGEHRVRIQSVEKAISKSQNDMITIILEVSGYTSRIWHHIVFLVDNPQITNRNLTQLFDSFGIDDGDFNLQNWIGKVGACVTKTDDYGAKVRYFIPKSKQDRLPPWKEVVDKKDGKIEDLKEVPIGDDDMPF